MRFWVFMAAASLGLLACSVIVGWLLAHHLVHTLTIAAVFFGALGARIAYDHHRAH